MKKLILATLAVVALTTQFASASQKKKVMIIGMDGVRSDALQAASTPNIDELIATGFYTYDSWHLGYTVSGPSWSAMFTGVWHQKNGVTDNSYAGSNFGQYPYYPHRAKEVKPNLYAVQIVDWAPMSTQVTNEGFDQKIVRTENDVTAVANAAITQLQNANLDAITVYFAKVDNMGHGSGFSPSNPIYMAAIHEVDSAIGRVMAALHARPNYANEDWLVLICTDHGGVGTSHGGNSDNERHIWWIGSGNNVSRKQLVALQDPGSYLMPANPVNPVLLAKTPVQSDIAVTAIHHLLSDDLDSAGFAQKRQQWDLDGKSWLDSLRTTSDPVDTSHPPTAIGKTNLPSMDIKVYPNPSSGWTSLWFDGGKGNKEVSCQVYDVTGKLVLQAGPSAMVSQYRMNVDLSPLPAGQYFVRIYADDKIATKPVILHHQ
ncbi:alkaline phosphatase family protein [Taibaiella koreensis]|uniref:alkaline phosphatase family protein n=1 Tax=Taibaiella koreensis TaxID=1268548 RepID=UPI0013C371CC|nr:alkaline phosphatase family protein [Taibaiella koreensis]